LLKAAAVPGEIDIYYVRLGDTLWKISRKYKTSLDCVIRYNPHLPDPDLIYPGDEIAVPLS
jgi:spore coat assembly protein SafA